MITDTLRYVANHRSDMESL